MARRAEIKSMGPGALTDSEGNARSGVVVEITNRDGTPATAYAAETGGSTTTPTTNADGEIAGWLDEGSYKFEVDGEEINPEAASGETARTTFLRPSDDVADSFGLQFQFVAEKNGSDSNSGLSWGDPKENIEAAIDELPEGGVIALAPGTYRPAETLPADGHAIVGASRGAGSGSNAGVTIAKNFAGPLFQFNGGGMVRRCTLVSTGDNAGAAIYALGQASNNLVGRIFLEDVTVTYEGSASNRWERGIHFDGSLSAGAAPGIRDCFLSNVSVFECETVGETVVFDRVVALHCMNLALYPTTGSPSLGIKVLHNDSRNILFTGCLNSGTFVSDAAAFLEYFGYIGGNITCNSGSNYNIFLGDVHAGTFTNNGGTANRREATVNLTSAWTSAQNFVGGIGGNISNQRLKVSGSSAGSPGIAEVYDRLSVSGAHGFGSFPVGAVGTVYGDKGFVTGEQSEPSNPGANTAHVFAMDNGSGKTQLCVRFATGVTQVIATEP